MKYLLSLLFTLFTFLIGLSQENSQTDILQQLDALYEKSEHTSDDIDQMIILCDELSVYNPELSLAHLKKVKVRMRKVNDLKNVTFYCSQLARNYTIIREFDQGLEAIDELYKEYKDELDRLQTIHFKIAKLTVLETKGDYEACLALIEEVLPKTELIENDYVKHYQAVMYNVKGSIFSIQRGKYKDAVASYLQVLRLYKEIDDEESNIAMTYNRLGLLYQNIEDLPKSVSYFLEGIKVLENTPPKSATDVYNLLILYSNLGNVYKEMNFLNKAIDYQNKALKLAEEVDSAIDKSRILHNLGSIYLEKDEFEKAIEYLLISQEMCGLLAIKEGVMYNHLALGEAYMKSENYVEAQKHYDKALIYVKEFPYPKGEVSIYKDYSELYKKLGDYNKALEYHTLYYNKEKELLGIETQEAIAQLEIEYETELKDEEIKRISYEYSIKKSENQRLIIGFISLVIITSGIIFFLIYRNKTLRDLYERNVELMNSFKNKSYTEQSDVTTSETFENPEEDSLKIIFNKLLFSLEKEKIYKDPDLSLSKVADIIKSNEKYVSSAISTYTNMNYNNFINSYRIQEAKLLIYENNRMNINEVMYASGFNSRTTFYDAFKKHTGMSPKQFKDMKTL
jgi:AraC-like DNA-binding protein